MDNEFANEELGKYIRNIQPETGYDGPYVSDNNYRDLNDLLCSYTFEFRRNKWEKYEYQGINVPRVTSIINDTINKEYLNSWAAKLGDQYRRTMDMILDTGTLAHLMIEDFINKGRISGIYDGVDNADQLKASRAYHNFVNFWNDLKKNGYIITPIVTEMEFATPWYGGTIDFIASITSPEGITRNYILDFKTSGKISFQYFLQTMAYKQACEYLRYTQELEPGTNPISNFKVPEINGIGIIRVDKESNKYEFIIADDQVDTKFLADTSNCVASMVNWYYRKQYMEDIYKDFRTKYIKEGGLYGIY